jgi:hypothetical protein
MPVRVFGLWNQVFHDYVGIRKALKAVSQVLDGRVGGHRRRSLRYSYNAGSAGLMSGARYPACDWGVGSFLFFWQDLVSRPRFGIQLFITNLMKYVCVCVYYCSTYYKAVRVGGGG